MGALLASGQGNPVAVLLSEECKLALGFVAGAGYAVGVDHEIPLVLEGAILDRVRWKLLLRLNVRSLMTEQREKAYEQALKIYTQVGLGRIKLTPLPAVDEAPASEQPAGPAAKFWRRNGGGL